MYNDTRVILIESYIVWRIRGFTEWDRSCVI